jgi:DNA-binding NarL/FixJ family response regulator
MNARRLSQAIAEGDGISIVVEVDSAEAARAAEDSRAEAVIVDGNSLPVIRAATSLPIICRGDRRLDGADAWIVQASLLGERELEPGLEWIVEVRKEDELEAALETVDPEIFLLSPEQSNGQSAIEQVLELLPDVPAGKLAIADIGARTREEVEELERAGVDGVIVAAGNVAHLVGAAPPEV